MLAKLKLIKKIDDNEKNKLPIKWIVISGISTTVISNIICSVFELELDSIYGIMFYILIFAIIYYTIIYFISKLNKQN
jgi:hypothetical protein